MDELQRCLGLSDRRLTAPATPRAQAAAIDISRVDGPSLMFPLPFSYASMPYSKTGMSIRDADTFRNASPQHPVSATDRVVAAPAAKTASQRLSVKTQFQSVKTLCFAVLSVSSRIVKQSRAITRSQCDDGSTLKTALCNGTSRTMAALLVTCRRGDRRLFVG